jgi:P27 family predicted phage terminase small subunit
MSRGSPRPVPVSLHRNRNTFRPSRHSRRAVEPPAPGDLSEPPEHFSPTQQAAWRETVANAPASILKAVDRGVLAAYIIAVEQHRQAAIMQAKIDTDAALPLLAKARDGTPTVSPYVRLMNRLAETIIRTASELGLTPVARARLAGPGTAPPPSDPSSPWTRLRLLQGGRDSDPSSTA